MIGGYAQDQEKVFLQHLCIVRMGGILLSSLKSNPMWLSHGDWAMEGNVSIQNPDLCSLTAFPTSGSSGSLYYLCLL